MSNFSFLEKQKEFALFSLAAIEAEKVYASSSAMCAIGCRKALELAIKWVYAADNTIIMPYRDNLQSLIHEESFRYAMDPQTWIKLPFVIKLGNLAVHTEKAIQQQDVLLSLKNLFDFIQWIDYCYGHHYIERSFDAAQIPIEKTKLDYKKIKEQQSLLSAKNEEIERLRKQIEALSAQYTADKKEYRPTEVKIDKLTEAQTRKEYIDLDLQLMGWNLSGDKQNVSLEYEVNDMAGRYGQKGYIDYVLWGRNGLPLAVVEAKRTSKDANLGRQQAVLYADALERKFGRRPFMFTTNGFETYFWDDKNYPQRQVSSIFSEGDLEKLMQRRTGCKDLITIPISDKITGRVYQKEAISAVCGNISKKFRKNLLVMATGTGKTRTAVSLTDVLSRGGYVTNVLFLADRTALVKQAKEAFAEYLPNMSLCNLLDNKDEKNARAVFSTYPTILNAIDDTKSKDGLRLFTPAHFDLIIIDECHRSIFKKYKAIFDYFDALIVGLTATPRMDVDRNTYEFFEVENGVPTYAYDYETAVYEDKVLVPYYNVEVQTKFLENGIKYDDLPEEEKKRYEQDFTEDGSMPDFIPSEKLNKFIFNDDTIDLVLQQLMEQGIKINGGEILGKTIIFAQNKIHAERIVERFNKLYPSLKGTFAQRVVCEDSYAQTLIDAFKISDKMPQIVVSVDMLDTGIDIPECVNLVFFKKVRSKTKFWQMIGRGTRLCPDLTCVDSFNGSYNAKKYFFIFDYCGNFEFFRQNPNGIEGGNVKSLSENIFCKKVELIKELQLSAFAEDDYQKLRDQLIDDCVAYINDLLGPNGEMRAAVKLQARYLIKFKEKSAFNNLSVEDVGELVKYIAPLVHINEVDIYAKSFDNLMYGMMLAVVLEDNVKLAYSRSQFNKIVRGLFGKSTIPQVKDKLSLIKQVIEPDFFKQATIVEFENVRKQLRDLVKFIVEGKGQPIIFTDLTDTVVNTKVAELLAPAYDFEDYKQKVNRYILGNSNNIVIHKLMHNVKLTSQDYGELERIFTQELGTVEVYHNAYGDTPFGLLVRKVAKLDHEAAMTAFAKFMNEVPLNDRQIKFVHKVITYIENNGYIDDVKELTKPPFDKPASIVKLFNAQRMRELMDIVSSIKDNALVKMG